MNLLALAISILVSVTSYPQSNIAGQEFEVSFNGTGVVANSNYYAKVLGGDNFTQVDTFNSSWLQQNAAWADMPQFISNSEGSISGTIKSRFETATSAGSQQLKVRIRKTDDDTNYDSEVVNINVSTPTPSPSPTPTPVSSTPSPTPVPTKSPTPPPTKSPSPSPVETYEPSILAENTATSDPTSIPSESPIQISDSPVENKFPVIAIVIIGLGIVLVGVSGYLVFKMRYNK